MPDEKPEEKKAICPCCGQPTLLKPVKVDGKIVDDYLASIMTGVPFNHTFSMFDGKLRITVSVASREEGLILYRFIFKVEPFSRDNTDLQDLLGVVNTYCVIKQIEVSTSDEQERIYYPSSHVVDECSKLLEKWERQNLDDKEVMDKFIEDVKATYHTLTDTDLLSATPPAILTHVINDFRGLEKIMLEAGFDENFWKGIELA